MFSSCAFYVCVLVSAGVYVGAHGGQETVSCPTELDLQVFA